MRIGSMDFIITEVVIVLISCILAKLLMDVAALVQLYLPCAVYGLVILGGAALGPTGWCCGKKRS